MKLNIEKLQKAGSIPLNATANFWGIKNNQYTQEYKNSVNSVINNPAALAKFQSLGIKNAADLEKNAYDGVIGPVHSALEKIKNSTTSFPNHLMRYPTQNYGFQTMAAKQFSELNKPEFDKHLSDLNNDSTAAYKKLTESVPGAYKIGNVPTKPYVNTLLNDRTRAGFAPRRKNGGEINYINYFVK